MFSNSVQLNSLVRNGHREAIRSFSNHRLMSYQARDARFRRAPYGAAALPVQPAARKTWVGSLVEWYLAWAHVRGS
jgi:hypothetical protein